MINLSQNLDEELKTDHEILKEFADPKKWIKDYEVLAWYGCLVGKTQ
jgi:hypothetical protein